MPQRNYLTPRPADNVHQRWSFAGHTDVVRAISWSPDGTMLASAGKDGTLRLWNCVTGTALGVLGQVSAWMTSIAWHPAQPLIASGTSDKRILLWHPTTKRMLTALEGHTGRITALRWMNNAAELASASADKSIRLWNIEQHCTLQHLHGHTAGQAIGTIKAHQASIVSIAWSPDGRSFASAGEDKTIHVWSAD